MILNILQASGMLASFSTCCEFHKHHNLWTYNSNLMVAYQNYTFRSSNKKKTKIFWTKTLRPSTFKASSITDLQYLRMAADKFMEE